jgi:hypothetical protein
MDFMSKDVKIKAQTIIQNKIEIFNQTIQSMKEKILINESKIRVINLSNRTKNKIEKMLQMELKRLKIPNYDQIHLSDKDCFQTLSEEIESLKKDIETYLNKIKSIFIL